MIGHLRGTLASMGEMSVIIDVGGVGYHVECSETLPGRLPPVGSALTLIIETMIRDERIRLFGFRDVEERDWFRLLLGVQGVGVKVALAIIGMHDGAKLSEAILLERDGDFRAVSGVGARLARRIITELRDRLPPATTNMTASLADGAATPDRRVMDLVSALVNLGYSEPESRHAARDALARGDGDMAQLIRISLGFLNRSE